MKHTPSRIITVGLDLDGVILYNPIRIFRPWIAFLKRLLFKRKRATFYIPDSRFTRLVWRLFHRTSIFIAPGYDKIIDLARQKKIRLYIITARYSFLKDDLNAWLMKLPHRKYITRVYYNESNQQPTLFKEQLIRKLNVNIFVEDNWDIVKHLGQTLDKKIVVYWITNIFDDRISYPHKVRSLKEAYQFIHTQLTS